MTFLNPIRKLLAPPVFEDDESNRIARLLHTVLLSAATVVLAVIAIIFIANTAVAAILPLTITFVAFMLAYVLMRYSRAGLALARWVVPLTALGGLSFMFISGIGLRDTYILAFTLPILMASLLLGARGGLIVGVLASATLAAVMSAIVGKVLILRSSSIPELDDVVIITLVLLLDATIIFLTVRSLDTSLAQTRRNEEELKTLSNSLDSAWRNAPANLLWPPTLAEVCRRCAT